ncbi:hypothetical protein [Streptodolium elevatio]|uniref:Uncharacterized protein n=1 Tax=Streptodolium elevatio TaxID=3157996 RepID=A0ABV3DS08_9ACTN
MRFLPDNLFPVGSTTAASDTSVDRIPQGRDWLRGLALNPAAPAAVRRRLLGYDPSAAGAFPERAVCVDDLRALVDENADRPKRCGVLLTTAPPEDMAETLDRTGAPEVRFRFAGDEEIRTDAEKWLRGETTLKWREGRLVEWTPSRWNASARGTAVIQEMYATADTPGWRRLAEHPWFVTYIGLARFADHGLAFARLAAVEDPAIDGAALGRLLADPSATLRWWARRDRRLPWPWLRPLLETHPEDAAANPGLPSEVMHRLLDIVGLPDEPAL